MDNLQSNTNQELDSISERAVALSSLIQGARTHLDLLQCGLACSELTENLLQVIQKEEDKYING